jgi:DNA-binding LacI/PurR family transcriptional regulator
MADTAQPSRRPTLADVAARVGVSTALVSLAIRDVPGVSASTREKILQAAHEIGYRPDTRARLLRSNRSHLIGVCFGVQHAFHGDLVGGLYDAAEAAGYELTLSAFTAHRDEQRAVASLLQDRCEAMILLGPASSPGYLAELANRIPLVVVARSARGVDVVRTADDEGLQQAVDHLVGLGHRHIAHIDGGRAPGAAERRRGYRQAMQRHGLNAEIHVIAGGLTEDDGAAGARALLAENSRPTAVAVFNDRSATGVLDVARTAGLSVPADLSVVGFDNSRLARLSQFDLTTVAQDVERLTALAVARAVDRLDGRPIARREQIVPPHLIVRSTTSAPGDGQQPQRVLRAESGVTDGKVIANSTARVGSST